MSIKKFAMMLFATGLIFAFSGNTACASEGANIVSENSEVTTDNTEVSEDTTEESNDTESVIQQPSEDTANQSNATKETSSATGKKAKKTKKYSKSELRLMASIINCEAGGESFQGKLAVGIVVMNRVKAKNFPNTVRKVIYQKFQFSPVRNGMLNKKLKQYDQGKIHSAQWKSCISAAKKALNGQNYIIKSGKKKSMSGIKFFSVQLAGAKFRLGGHRFK